MSADHTSDVLEFGPTPAVPGRRWAAVASDPRTAISLLVLGGAAGIGSLVGEWQTTTLNVPTDPDVPSSQSQFVADVNTVGAAGTGYVMALLALATLAVVAMAGRQRVRPTARLAGLALAGATTVLLAATAYSLSTTSQLIKMFGGMGASEEFRDAVISVERGMWAGFAAVGLIAAAMWLSHRQDPTSFGRRVRDPEPEEPESGPMELSVSAATPFVR